jgi:hypothetical protein
LLGWNLNTFLPLPCTCRAVGARVRVVTIFPLAARVRVVTFVCVFLSLIIFIAARITARFGQHFAICCCSFREGIAHLMFGRKKRQKKGISCS